uniref:Uncharacterized protein n=1 Tax=Anguilla anguilla TaxID=7936 RepID=A0A0E9WUN4_ANGAN
MDPAVLLLHTPPLNTPRRKVTVAHNRLQTCSERKRNKTSAQAGCT